MGSRSVSLSSVRRGGLVAFYDIDTPVTLAALADGSCEYLSADLIPGFDLYLSFTGGPVLRQIEHEFGAPAARVLYCGVDPDCHRPAASRPELGSRLSRHLQRGSPAGARSADVRPGTALAGGPLCGRGFALPVRRSAGRETSTASNISIPPGTRAFYARQRFTLNVTRANMICRGYSPSVRLFEAAACGTPIISDWWAGLDEVLSPGPRNLDRRQRRRRAAISARSDRNAAPASWRTARANAFLPATPPSIARQRSNPMLPRLGSERTAAAGQRAAKSRVG